MSNKLTVDISQEDKDFLNLVIHEDAAKNLSEAVHWAIDSCRRIEKLYGVDACYVSFNDIRSEECPRCGATETRQMASEAGMSQQDFDRQTKNMRNKTKKEIIKKWFGDELDNAIDAIGEYFITMTEKAME